jgi:DNA polymerase-3 subunit gamma/tau
MRDALSLTDQAIAYAGGKLEANAVRAMLGSVDREHAQRFVRALAARDGKAVLAGVDALREHGLSAAGTLEELAGLLQQMAIEQAVPGALPDTDPDTPVTRELAALLPADETQLLYSFALHGRQELTLAPDAYAGLSMVLLRLLAFAPAGGGGAPARPAPVVPTAAASGRAVAASAALAKPAPRVNVPVSPPPVVMMVREPSPPPWLADVPPEDVQPLAPARVASPAAATTIALEPTPLGDRWVAVVAMLVERQSIAALVRELALQAQLLEQCDGAQPLWRLRVERESLRAPALVDKLRGALAEALGIAPLRLEVEAGVVTDSPARRDAAERERRQREAEATIRSDPFVQDLLAQFPSARIVPGSIKPRSSPP